MASMSLLNVDYTVCSMADHRRLQWFKIIVVYNSLLFTLTVNR